MGTAAELACQVPAELGSLAGQDYTLAAADRTAAQLDTFAAGTVAGCCTAADRTVGRRPVQITAHNGAAFETVCDASYTKQKGLAFHDAGQAGTIEYATWLVLLSSLKKHSGCPLCLQRTQSRYIRCS